MDEYFVVKSLSRTTALLYNIFANVNVSFFSSSHSSIGGAINTITAGGEFILVYKNINGGTAYLPDADGNFRELLDHLVTR